MKTKKQIKGLIKTLTENLIKPTNTVIEENGTVIEIISYSDEQRGAIKVLEWVMEK